VFINVLTEIANSSDSPQGLRVLALSAIESATALDVAVPNALRQAQSIEDITLRVTIQQAVLAAFIEEPQMSASSDDIVMTAQVEYPELV